MKSEPLLVASQILLIAIPGLVLVGIISECSNQISKLKMPPPTNLFYTTLGASGTAMFIVVALVARIGIQWVNPERLRGIMGLAVALMFALFLATGLFATGHALKVMLDRNDSPRSEQSLDTSRQSDLELSGE